MQPQYLNQVYFFPDLFEQAMQYPIRDVAISQTKPAKRHIEDVSFLNQPMIICQHSENVQVAFPCHEYADPKPSHQPFWRSLLMYAIGATTNAFLLDFADLLVKHVMIDR